MKSLRVGITTVLMVVMLAACALAPAKSFDDKLTYATSSQAGIARGTATSLDAHQISGRDAVNVRELLVKITAFIDAAKEAGDTETGNQNLDLANAALTQLQKYLNARTKQ